MKDRSRGGLPADQLCGIFGYPGGLAMKLYRIDKLAKLGGMVLKRKHILAQSDRQAVAHAEDSSDCPICEVSRDGESIGHIV